MDTLSQTLAPAPEAHREPPQGGAPAAAPARQRQAPPATPRRSKADALRIANRLKRGVAIAAMLGFSMFGVVVGNHISATAATTTSSSSTSTGTSSTTSSGSYFTQPSGGSSFSSSSSTSTSTPVTSTGVS